ncbi:MAG: hypothetical protein KDD61_04105 [Bdellovibrionales bacterium]|nr:hypothetical protein [Bdellovibrionales bacterium]
MLKLQVVKIPLMKLICIFFLVGSNFVIQAQSCSRSVSGVLYGATLTTPTGVRQVIDSTMMRILGLSSRSRLHRFQQSFENFQFQKTRIPPTEGGLFYSQSYENLRAMVPEFSPAQLVKLMILDGQSFYKLEGALVEVFGDRYPSLSVLLTQEASLLFSE